MPLNYNLIYVSVDDKKNANTNIPSATDDNIVDFEFDYEFFQNTHGQLLLSVIWTVDAINIKHEKILDISVTVAIDLGVYDEIKSASFDDFKPLLNLTFNRFLKASEKHLTESLLQYPSAPDWDIYSAELLSYRDAFIASLNI